MLLKIKYKKRACLLGMVALLFFTFAITFMTSEVHGVSSLQINFSGKIVTSSGLDISYDPPSCILAGDDSCDFQVKYYDHLSTGTLLGSEVFTNVEIGDFRGYFNLKMGGGSYTAGSYSSLKDIFLSEPDVYVEILFDGSGVSDFEATNDDLERFLVSHSPVERMSVGASPYSISSRGAIDEFQLKVKTSATGTSKGLIYFDGAENVVKVYDGTEWQTLAYETVGGSSLLGLEEGTIWEESGENIFFTGGNVGIGTSTPGGDFRLSVLGDTLFSGNISNVLSSDNLPEVLGSNTVNLVSAKDFVVYGDYIFLVEDGTPAILRIYDIKTSRNPSLVESFSLTSFDVVHGLKVSGNYAYILADDSLITLNISDVKNVSLLNVEQIAPLNEEILALDSQGRFAYLVLSNNSFVSLDLSGSNPVVLDDSLSLGSIELVDMVVNGKYVYVLTEDSIIVVDISDSSNPSILSTKTGLGFSSTKATSFSISGRYGYVTTSSNLYVLNIFNPNNIQDISNISLNVSSISDIILSGNYVFVLNGASPSSLLAVDVSNVNGLDYLGSIAFQTGKNNGKALQIQGKYGYVLTEGGFVVFDLKGIQTNSLLTNSFESFSGFVHSDFSVNRNLSVSGGMQVGEGGIYVGGDLGVEGQVRIVGGLGVGAGDSVYINNDGYLVAGTSSIRYKRNVESYGAVLSKLSNLDLVRFTWNDQTMSGGTQDIGMIAEEVAKYIPELVTYNSFGQAEGLKYDKMGAYAIAGLQELSQEFYSFREEFEESTASVYTSDVELMLGSLVSLDFSKGENTLKLFDNTSSPLLGIVSEMIEVDEEEGEIFKYRVRNYRGFGSYEALVARSFESEQLEYPAGSPVSLGLNGELQILDEEDVSSLVIGYIIDSLEFEEDSFVELTPVYLTYAPLSFGFTSFGLSSLFNTDSVYNGLTIGGSLVNFHGKVGSFLILNTDMLNVDDRVLIFVDEEDTPRINVDGEDLLEKISELEERLSEFEGAAD